MLGCDLQAYKRQIGLIGKMLNSLEDDKQEQLEDVLQRASQNTGFKLDPKVELQTQQWHASILDGNEVCA